MSFKTPYHPHPFITCKKNGGWVCDGYKIFGKCKSGFEDSNESCGKERFRCTVCFDFDLCKSCLGGERIKIADVKIGNSI